MGNNYFTRKSIVTAIVTLFTVLGVFGQATLVSDEPDYAPGSTATFTGNGFQPGEFVKMQVLHADDTPNTGLDHEVWYVTASVFGSFVTTWHVCEDDCLGSTLRAYADGQSSGLQAYVEFTDGNVRFNTTGLPTGINVTVNYSYPVSNTGSVTFSTSGSGNSSNIVVPNGTNFTYTFPSTISNGSDTYLLTPTGSQSATIANGQNTFTGTYALQGGSGGLTVSAPLCAQGGLFTINYTPESGSSVSETRTTPFSFIVKKNTAYSISSIASAVNGNNYTGSSTINGVTPNTNGFISLLTLTYSDTQNPSIVNLPNNISVNNISGSCGAVVTWTEPTSNDNCSGHSVSQTNGLANGGLFPVGTSVVEYTALDAAGNDVSASFSVTVNDTEDPSIVGLPTDITLSNDLGACGAVVTWTEPTSNDNCAGHSVSQTNGLANGALFPVGTSVVEYTALDAAGNDVSASFSVTVNDTEDPSIVNLPTDIIVSNDSGACGALVTWTEPTSNDNCAGHSVSQTNGLANGGLFPVGTSVVEYTALDAAGNDVSASFNVTVNDTEKPTWSTILGSLNRTLYCGQNSVLANAQALIPSATDNCPGIVTLNKTAGTFIPSATGGSYTNTWTATDASGNIALDVFTQVITINNFTIDASASSTPVALGSTAILQATVTPIIAGVTVDFYLDGVLKGSSNTNASGLATFSVSGLTADVYAVKAVANNGCSESNAYLVVYDPNGGFVTGGGWYMSPTGAYVSNPTLTGKANFGFVAKYKKGSTQVEGNTEFQFQSGDINFKSTTHNSMSLVIAGAQAIYKGVGTINNVSGYSFMVSAIDGDMKTNPVSDKFRIKIWNTSSGAIVYDNQLGQLENVEATTALGGGSIVIHQAKKNAKEGSPDIVVDKDIHHAFNIKAYPNPSSQYFNLNIEGNEGDEAEVIIYNMNGMLMHQFKEKVNQEFQMGQNWARGMYMVQIKKGDEVKTIKLLKDN